MAEHGREPHFQLLFHPAVPLQRHWFGSLTLQVRLPFSNEMLRSSVCGAGRVERKTATKVTCVRRVCVFPTLLE